MRLGVELIDRKLTLSLRVTNQLGQAVSDAVVSVSSGLTKVATPTARNGRVTLSILLSASGALVRVTAPGALTLTHGIAAR